MGILYVDQTYIPSMLDKTQQFLVQSNDQHFKQSWNLEAFSPHDRTHISIVNMGLAMEARISHGC